MVEQATVILSPRIIPPCTIGHCNVKGSHYQGGNWRVRDKLRNGVCPICDNPTVKKYIDNPLGLSAFQVHNFAYNGFCGDVLDGMAPYLARFGRWTDDPGVALCHCTDGRDRLIPTFALIGDRAMLPAQDYSRKVMFGLPSHS